MAAGAGGRSAEGGVSGHKGQREEEGGRSGEGGWNRDAAGRPRGEAETGRRKTTARGRMTEEEDRGRRGQESQVSSDRDRGELRKRDGFGERDDASKGWSGGSEGDLAESEPEEDRMTAGDPEGSGNMLTTLPWGTQESGAGGLQGGARAGGRDTRKPPSAAADEEEARGRHGERPGQGGKTEAGGKIREAKPQ